MVFGWWPRDRLLVQEWNRLKRDNKGFPSFVVLVYFCRRHWCQYQWKRYDRLNAKAIDGVYNQLVPLHRLPWILSGRWRNCLSRSLDKLSKQCVTMMTKPHFDKWNCLRMWHLRGGDNEKASNLCCYYLKILEASKRRSKLPSRSYRKWRASQSIAIK